FATYRSWTGYLRARLDGPLGLTQSLQMNGYDLSRANLGGDFPSTFRATRRGVRWQADRTGWDGRFGLAFGAEYERTSANLSTGQTADLRDTSAFVVARVQPVEALKVTASLRSD